MNPLDRTCDAFLDDRMSPAEKDRFEMRLVREPGLAAAVDLHREVEASIRRTMVVPDLSGLVDRIEAAAEQMRGGGAQAIQGSIRWLAAAGTLLIMCVAICVASVVMAGAQNPGDNPGADNPGGEPGREVAVREWSNPLADVVGISLATASALMAKGVGMRRVMRQRLAAARGRGTLAGSSGSDSAPSDATLHSPDSCATRRVSRAIRLAMDEVASPKRTPTFVAWARVKGIAESRRRERQDRRTRSSSVSSPRPPRSPRAKRRQVPAAAA